MEVLRWLLFFAIAMFLIVAGIFFVMIVIISLVSRVLRATELRVAFDITTDPSVDQVLANMRYSQAQSQLPQDVVNQGVTVMKSVTSPLGVFVLYSPKGTYDPLFLANYAHVNINDPMTRVPGSSSRIRAVASTPVPPPRQPPTTSWEMSIFHSGWSSAVSISRSSAVRASSSTHVR
mgnify:CR=1 FL=1